MSGRTQAWLPAAMIVLAIALLQAGCGDDRQPLRPATATCFVEGRVARFTLGDQGTRVRFNRIGEVQGAIEVPVDDTGHFRLELPVGDYCAAASAGGDWCWLLPGGGLGFGSDGADTLRLVAGAAAFRCDFLFGALRLATVQAAGLAAPIMSLELSQSSRWDLTGNTVRIVDGDTVAGNLVIDSGPLAPGDYRVRVRWRRDWNSYGENFWLPGVAGWDSATWYHVGADSVCEVAAPFAAAPARLRGHVTGAWQALGATTPRLAAHALDGSMVAGPCELAPDGSFAFDLHRPLPVRLEVADNNSRYWLGGLTEADATVYDPAPGQTITGIDAVMSGAAVRDHGGARPRRDVRHHRIPGSRRPVAGAADLGLVLVREHVGLPAAGDIPGADDQQQRRQRAGARAVVRPRGDARGRHPGHGSRRRRGRGDHVHARTGRHDQRRGRAGRGRTSMGGPRRHRRRR